MNHRGKMRKGKAGFEPVPQAGEPLSRRGRESFFAIKKAGGIQDGGTEMRHLSFPGQIRPESEVHPWPDLEMAHQFLSGLEGLHEIPAPGRESQGGGAI